MNRKNKKDNRRERVLSRLEKQLESRKMSREFREKIETLPEKDKEIAINGYFDSKKKEISILKKVLHIN